MKIQNMKYTTTATKCMQQQVIKMLYVCLRDIESL